MDETWYRVRNNGQIKTMRIWIEQDGNEWKVMSESAQSETAKKRQNHDGTYPTLADAEFWWRSKRKKKAIDEGYSATRDEAINDPKFMPMLALKTMDTKTGEIKPEAFAHITYPLILQRKFDGIRCLASTEPDGSILLLSRKRNPIPVPVPLLRQEIANLPIPDDVILDGELYVHGDDADFERTKGWFSTGDKAGIEAKEREFPNYQQLIKYRVYDFYDPDNPDLTYEERYKLLEQWLDPNSDRVILTKNYYANDFQEAHDLAEQFLKEGYEGGIARLPQAKYLVDGRNKNHLLKLKFWIDDEFQIVGFKGGDKPASKDLVTWRCWSELGNKVFDVTPDGTEEQRRKWLKEGEKHIGSDLTVRFEKYSKDGIPLKGRGKAIRDYE